VSLEIRENHQLVSGGVYKLIRHPMYSSLFLYSASQAFLLPNWIIGPAGVITFTVLFLLRLRSEGQMMLDKFGPVYGAFENKRNASSRAFGEVRICTVGNGKSTVLVVLSY
jgi:protein-S-isoprenylcysteine O-methyltransferase Ste14